MASASGSIVVIGLLSFLVTGSAGAQNAADSAGIRAAALDYIEGWYTADAPRMTRALHPELAKRIVETDPKSHKSVLSQMGAKELIGYTRGGGGRETPAKRRQADVSILDIYQGAASAKGHRRRLGRLSPPRPLEREVGDRQCALGAQAARGSRG